MVSTRQARWARSLPPPLRMHLPSAPARDRHGSFPSPPMLRPIAPCLLLPRRQLSAPHSKCVPRRLPSTGVIASRRGLPLRGLSRRSPLCLRGLLRCSLSAKWRSLAPQRVCPRTLRTGHMGRSSAVMTSPSPSRVHTRVLSSCHLPRPRRTGRRHRRRRVAEVRTERRLPPLPHPRSTLRRPR